MKKIAVVLLSVVAIPLLSACHHSEAENPPLIGGDRDEHGCIGSAGYSWDEAKQECVRPWEEN